MYSVENVHLPGIGYFPIKKVPSRASSGFEGISAQSLNRTKNSGSTKSHHWNECSYLRWITFPGADDCKAGIGVGRIWKSGLCKE